MRDLLEHLKSAALVICAVVGAVLMSHILSRGLPW